MKTGILFDLDGTLLSTLEDLQASTNAALREFGCPERTLDEVRRFVGNGARRLIELALPGTPEDPPVEQVLAFYQSYYAAHSQEKTRPYDGILEALERIKKEFPVAIVSNKPDAAVKILCRQYFGDTYARGESELCPRKPAPDMVLQTMKTMGVERCIYVGDSEVDVLTAKNAAVPCLSVTWGFRDRQCLTESGAEYICDHPLDMPQMLGKINEEVYGK